MNQVRLHCSFHLGSNCQIRIFALWFYVVDRFINLVLVSDFHSNPRAKQYLDLFPGRYKGVSLRVDPKQPTLEGEAA